MSLIPCSDDCVYQSDGYCLLETPAVVTNHEKNGCVHYIQFVKSPQAQPFSASNASRTLRTPMSSMPKSLQSFSDATL